MPGFLEKVAAGLQKCGVSRLPVSVLLAVSGGIDSMVMLYALKALSEASLTGASLSFPLRLSAVTVNHNLRSLAESGADAAFVKEHCAVLHLPCTVKTIAPGVIAQTALNRGCGIEDAARFMRYALLEEQAEAESCDFVFLAHNRDDQLETLLQRFFQGAAAGISGTAAAGIARRRGIFCRPLLDIRRSEIASYAREVFVPFREDGTNSDISYYRNNLRNFVVPFLNEHVKGWDTGVLAGAEKAGEEAAFIEKLACALTWEPVFFDFVAAEKMQRIDCKIKNRMQKKAVGKDAGIFAVRTDAETFFKTGFPVRIRSLYAALQKIGCARRIPYTLLRACAFGQRRVKGCGIECVRTKRFLYVKNTGATPGTEQAATAFCIQIDSPGLYDTGFADIEAVFVSEVQLRKTQNRADNKYGEVCTGPFSLPLRIRSRRAGDRIKTAEGTRKSLKKIWNEWSIEPHHAAFVPVIEYDGTPVCVWGSPFGYPDWYVKDCADRSPAVFLFCRAVQKIQ